MNAQRKKIIIAEIRYWKQHKLLPDHYCDFLITLYAQGEELDKLEVSSKDSVLQQERKKFKPSYLFIFIAPIASVLGMWFLDQYPMMMIASVTVIILLYLLLAIRRPIGKVDWSPFLYISAAFMFLLLSLRVWEWYFIDQPIMLVLFMSINCLLWIIAGKVLNRLYFTISGIAGLLLIFVYYFWTL